VAVGGYRQLQVNRLTGTLPTELGNMDALKDLCVRHPHPPRLDARAVIGLWAECGGDVGCAGIYTTTVILPVMFLLVVVSRGRCPQSWAPWTR
jgi:hypothetical protein